MTIASYGYTGSVDEVQWAFMATFAGQRWMVPDAASLKVTIGGSGDRAVTIAAGTVFGDGVLDVVTGTTNKNAATLGSGTRWDTVVLTRTWGGGAATVLAVNTGTSTKQQTIVNNTPGVVADQPLALIQVVAGQTAIQDLVDLRTPSGKVLLTASLPALSVPSPSLGWQALAVDTGNRWAVQNISGTPTWVDLTTPVWTTFPLAGGGALKAVDSVLAYTKDSAQRVALRGSVQRTSGADLVPTGGSTDCLIGTLPAGFRPLSGRRFAFAGGPGVFGRAFVDSSGQLFAEATGQKIDHAYLDGVSFYAEQ